MKQSWRDTAFDIVARALAPAASRLVSPLAQEAVSTPQAGVWGPQSSRRARLRAGFFLAERKSRAISGVRSTGGLEAPSWTSLETSLDAAGQGPAPPRPPA